MNLYSGFSHTILFKQAELIVPFPLFISLWKKINTSMPIVWIDQFLVMKAALEFSTKVVLMASICFMHCCHTAYISTLVFVYFYKYLYIYPWEARDLDNHYILWWLTESCQCGDFWIIFGLQGSTIGEGHALWSPQPFVRRSQPNCSP